MAEEQTSEGAAEPDFEASLQALEALVRQMESGELGLEASLQAFEQGVALTRHCQTALKRAALRVQMLSENNELEDLDLGVLNDSGA